MIDIENATKEELIKEHELMIGDIWSKYSCDCLGFYVADLHRKIVELGGWI
jgi:hypothetical protein